MVGTILFNLFIQPLELIFEIIFYALQLDEGIAIIAISLVMNFLALPLYKRADDIQVEERDKVASMSKWVDHIKKTFKGDERYMMLTEYYRSQNYKQLYSLRSSFPLLLQVPFFIAAYHYLSNLDLLNGAKFLFLENLGKPDGLLQIGALSINIMPIIMTLINVVSAFIYLRGFPIKDKIQTYGIAAIFLILLYDSPSGLVFYWTCNQIFSVCKNIVMKLVASAQAKRRLACAENSSMEGSISVTRSKKISRKPLKTSTFILGGVFISVLLGVMIPLSVIGSSASEFTTDFSQIIEWVVNTFSIALGFFVVWLGIYYYLGRKTFRGILTYAVWIMAGVFTMDYMVFQKDYGIMTSELVYSESIVISGKEKLINLMAVLALAAAMAVFIYFFSQFVNYAILILLIGAAVISGVNISNSASAINEVQKSVEVEVESSDDNEAGTDQFEKVLKFTKNGQNVIVLMLDRQTSGLVPYLFNENPELYEQFSGFTYYPNTLSHGSYTNYTTPALFGGYEYTVEANNKRSDETLTEKQNEALKVLPTLFSENDYNVTVVDPPYAGYVSIPDLSIYDGMENVSAYNLTGKYNKETFPELEPVAEKARKRNFFMYSLFCVMPTMVKSEVYNEGNYLSTDQLLCGRAFLESYAVLENLENITEIVDTDENQFLMMQNATPHEPSILQTPEYEPSANVDTSVYANGMTLEAENVGILYMESQKNVALLHVNMTSLMRLGEWFDYLKEQGVYDNTKIIIASDHGSYSWRMPSMFIENENGETILNAEYYNAFLMVKDFNATGDLVTDNTFMTNADVPTLATDGVIENPVNPYTGNEINSDAKSEPQLVTTAEHWSLTDNDGYTLNTEGGEFYRVSDNIFDPSCWAKVE